MTPALNSIDVIEIKREGQSAVSTAIEQAHDVIITDIVTYRSADSILSAVRKARKSVAWLIEERVDSIIKPILAGLDRLYDVRRTLERS
jgi:ABC-type ATPase with predicted acetyltransferase domain